MKWKNKKFALNLYPKRSYRVQEHYWCGYSICFKINVAVHFFLSFNQYYHHHHYYLYYYIYCYHYFCLFCCCCCCCCCCHHYLLFILALSSFNYILVFTFIFASARIPINFLLVNLAVSDIMIAIFLAPEYIFSLMFTHPNGVTGTVLCRLLTGGNFAWVGASSSVFTLVFIAIERYYAVIYPYDEKGKLTHTKLKVTDPPGEIDVD